MNARRLIGSALVTALAATTLSVVATAAPAQAVDTVETRIVPGLDGRAEFSSYSKPLAYGDDISVYVGVQAFVNGVWKDIYNGSVSVTEQLASGAAPTVVASSTSASVSDSFKARGNATYTVNYSGGTGEYPVVNYAPTTASYSVANVQRKITTDVKSGRKATYHGKINPRVGKAVVQIKKSKHGKWKKFKKVRVAKNGAWSVKVTGPRKGAWYYRVLVSAGGGFAASQTPATGIHRIF